MFVLVPLVVVEVFVSVVLVVGLGRVLFWLVLVCGMFRLSIICGVSGIVTGCLEDLGFKLVSVLSGGLLAQLDGKLLSAVGLGLV